MINRRIIGFDDYGMPEKLSDVDYNKFGIQINNTYYMQIIDRQNENAKSN